MKKVKLFIASIVALLSFAPMLAPVSVSAATGDLACGATGNLTATNCVADANADNKINDGVKLFIRIFQIVVGIISVAMIIFGGLKYITSGGDSGGIGSAKNTIIYAIIGLVVVALAEVIVQFVLNRVNTVGTGI